MNKSILLVFILCVLFFVSSCVSSEGEKKAFGMKPEDLIGQEIVGDWLLGNERLAGIFILQADGILIGQRGETDIKGTWSWDPMGDMLPYTFNLMRDAKDSYLCAIAEIDGKVIISAHWLGEAMRPWVFEGVVQ